MDGAPFDLHDGCLTLELHRDAEHEILIQNPVYLVNQPKTVLRENLLTRVQGRNNWKNAVFTGSEKKIPGFVREALAEFDAMDYE